MSGFIGESYSGKSTLIDTIRGIYPSEEGAAKSNVLECTSNPTPYHFPNNDKIILWYFPGVNTPNFPLQTYISYLNKEKLFSQENKR